MRLGQFKITCMVALIVLTSNLFVHSQSQSQSLRPSAPPISYGLLVDSSGSLRHQLEYVVETSKIIVNNNEPNDETFLVTFTDRKNIKRIKDFTQHKAAIIDATEYFYPQSGQTAIIDALYESAQYLAKNSKSDDVGRRRALILITDGEERESRQKLEQLLALLRENKIQVYAIGIMAQLEKDRGKKVSEKATSFLTNMAKETGGRVFFPQTVSELRSKANEMLNVIRNQ
jgi:Ca-activated chloride channel family protein